MEQFVLGIFQEELSKVLVGFKKEQVDANLLNGKGQIRDVNINCSIINDHLCKVAPFIQIESIRVSKLGFHVTSWANLKKAPIVVDVEDVEVVLVEPLSHVDKEHRLAIKQLSWAEFREYYASKENKNNRRGPYNLFDRILDNLQIEIRSISITFQTRGRFKTERKGPWTPPALHIQLRHLKYCSVDELGNEANPEDCWRHNKFVGHQRDQTLLVYKKASMHYTVGFRQAGHELKALPPLIKDSQVQADLVFHKKFSNGAILAIQLDVTLNQIQVDIGHESVPALAHTIAGMQYCFTKDRAFEDPLLSEGHGDGSDGNDTTGSGKLSVSSVIRTSTPIALTREGDESNDDDDTSQEKGAESCNDEDSQSILAEEGSIDGSVDNSDFDDAEIVDDDLVMPQDTAPGSIDTAQSIPVKQKKSRCKDRPVILLPSGLVIYSKLSFSVSIHDVRVRGIYESTKDGYIQLQAKGLVAEMIWPKVTREKGCYVQMSLSHIMMHEMHHKKIVTLLRGGTQHGTSCGPIEAPAVSRPEISRDESFPLFEDRSVRQDPLDLRHSFPAQAIGMKATMNFVDRVSDPEHEDILVLNEIAIDVLEIVASSESWCRAIRFALNDAGGGFDRRWQSGDWRDCLTTDMMRNPLQPFILSSHLLAEKQIVSDDRDMISSDLVNLTAKLLNITVKVPAAIQRDLRSCDIVVHLDELAATISSALPRKFVTGRIGSSIPCNSSINNEMIEFPNDPSDICYALDTETPRRRSTFRAQLTAKGLAVSTFPVIPFFDAVASRSVLAPLGMTLMLCLEGDSLSPDSDSAERSFLLSMQITHLDVNCDFDMITGAMSSIFYQLEVVDETVAAIQKLPGFETAPCTAQSNACTYGDDTEDQPLIAVDERNTLVEKQLKRSRETGGFNVDLSVHVASIGLHFWRQNVPMNSRFRESISADSGQIDEHPIPLIKLMAITLKDIEVGFEASIQPQRRRHIVKACISELQIDVCDFAKASARHLEMIDGKNGTFEREENTLAEEPGNNARKEGYRHANTSSSKDGIYDDNVTLLNIGGESGKDIMVRFENYCQQAQSVSIAVDLDVGGVVTLHIQEIEMFFLLAIEALLLPTEVKPMATGVDRIDILQFPEGSTGALLMKGFRLTKMEGVEPTASSIDVKKVAMESDSLDQLMHVLILGMLPEDISEFFLRISLADLLIFVPHQSDASAPDAVSAPWLGHNLCEASLLTGFVASSRAPDGLVTRLSRKGVTWTSLFPDHHSGFHHKIKTSQGLFSAEYDGTQVVLRKALINAFDLGVIYGPQNINISMGDSTLSLQDLQNLRSLYSSMVDFVHRFKLMLHRMNSVTSALSRNLPFHTHHDASQKSQKLGVDQATSVVVADEAKSSLQSGRYVLEHLKRLFEIHDAGMRAKIRIQENEIDRLRLQVFLKERSRVAALSLVSFQAAGWLRVEGVHMTGERSQTSSSMWRYHAVLRKSLLILYSGPGKPRPVDVVSLQGAALLTLEGGRRKRDVKNGFAIRERTGCTRYMLAPSGLELDLWLQELQKAVKTYSGDGLDDDTTAEMPEVIHNDSGGRVRARTLSSDPGSFDDGSAHGVIGKPKRSQIIKERLSKASAITRSSLGTAIQAAKHRGQKGSSRDEDDSESNPVPDPASQATTAGSSQPLKYLDAAISTPDYLLQSSSTSSTAFATETDVEVSESVYIAQEEILTSREGSGNQRFGSLRSKTKTKLSSAFQGAREKALAVTEEMRRRQHERDVAEDNVLSGIRGRIGKAATSVKLAIEKTETSSTVIAVNRESKLSEADQDPFLSQSTGQHTNDDTSVAGNCERVILPERLATEEVDADADYDDQTPVAGSVFRSRITKIGAVVKNVTHGSQMVKGSASVQGEIDPDKISRFSLRKSQRQRGASKEESDLMKLKALRIGSRLSEIDRSGDRQSSTLAKIKGCWVVLVQSRDFSANQVPASSPDEDTPLSMIGTAASVDHNPELAHELKCASEVPMIVPESGSMEEPNGNGEHCRFLVRCLSQDPVSQKKIKVSTIDRSFQEVIGLFIDVLECVQDVPETAPPKLVDVLRDATAAMNDDLASSLGISPLDVVKLTGELLGGLLSASSSFHRVPSYHDYECEVLTEFLNATLQCPMPISGCMAVLEFLDIVDAGVMPINMDGEETPAAFTGQSLKLDILKEPADLGPDIVALTSSCLAHLQRAEASGILAQKLGQSTERKPQKKVSSIRRSASMPLTVPFLEQLLPSSISKGLRDAMHDALKNVMTERDEAQASLIASSLSHVHEVERERKHGDLAKKKLRAAEAEARRHQQGGLFGVDRFKDPRSEEWKEVQRHLEEMVKNADNEIESLSQQLTKEVADKTAAKLEAYRLQDSMQLLRASDLAEKQALADELRNAREQLDELKDKSRSSDEEVKRLTTMLAKREENRG